MRGIGSFAISLITAAIAVHGLEAHSPHVGEFQAILSRVEEHVDQGNFDLGAKEFKEFDEEWNHAQGSVRKASKKACTEIEDGMDDVRLALQRKSREESISSIRTLRALLKTHAKSFP